MKFRQWLMGFWHVPNVGRTHAMHVQDVQLMTWSHAKLREFNERLEALEVRVDTLLRDAKDYHHDDDN